MQGHALMQGFLSAKEVEQLLFDVDGHSDDFVSTGGKSGFGPRYRVIDGERIASVLPAVALLARERVFHAVESFASVPLELLDDSRRCMRVQSYHEQGDGFRWHFDGHDYAAVLTLRNETLGQTQILGRAVSALARPLFYLLYPFPAIFDVFPRKAVKGRPGDLLILRGRHHIHRGWNPAASGGRVVAVFGYNRRGSKPSRLRNGIARFLNY